MELLNQLDIDHKDQADFVNFYNQTIAYDFNGVLAGCDFEDEDSGKLTYNVGLINLDENHVEMVTNVRYPITSDYKAVVESLKNQYQAIKLDYQLDDHMPPIYFPKDHPLIEKLMKVYQDHTGDMSPASTTGGGTYARACDNIVAFGGVFPGDPELAHQKNEYIEIKNLIKTAQIYASAIYELAKED
jgi:succinyl-diaminopimelate desuccinylase